MSTTDDLRALLDEWKALSAAATEGPWRRVTEPGTNNHALHDPSDVDIAIDYEGVWYDKGDAEFIAASRTIVPRLIAAVEAVLAEERTPAACEWDWGYNAALDDVVDLIRAALIGATTTDRRAGRIEHDACCPHPKCPGGGLCCCLSVQGGQP